MIDPSTAHVGQRVRLREGLDGPPCRTGTIVRLCPKNGGPLVLHDLPCDMGILGRRRTFGWCWAELDPAPEIVGYA